MKRLFSFLLALAMLMAMSIPVFADDSAYQDVNKSDKIISADTTTENGVITISNAAVGTTYTAYKIFDADIVPGKQEADLEGVTYTLEPNSDACALLFGTEGAPKENNYFKYDWVTHRVTASAQNLNTTDLAKYLQDLVKANPNVFPHVSLTAVAPTSGEGAGKQEVTLAFNGLQYGYYLIDRGTSGGVATLNSSAPTMTVVDKNQMPSDVDKELKLLGETNYSDPSNTVNISDVVTYKIEFTATNYAGQEKIRYYEIHDVKGTGIWAEFNSFKVKIGEEELPGYYVKAGGEATDAWSHLDSWPNGVTPDIQEADWYLVHKGYDNYSILIPWIEEYTVRDNADGTQTVVVAANGTSKYDSPVNVEITYNATIEPNAAIGPNTGNTDSGPNKPNLFNTAQLQWFSQVTNGYTDSDTVYSETYGLSILKQGQKQGEGAKPVLAGAKFKVYKDQAQTQPLYVIPTGVDGVYILDSYGTDGERVSGLRMDTARKYFEYMRDPDGKKIESQLNEDLKELKERPNLDENGNQIVDQQGKPVPAQTNEVVTADNGRLVILGLNLGTYYFEETEAPIGYNKLEKSFPITITKESNKKVSIYSKADGSVVTDKNQAAYEYSYYLTDNAVENSKGAVLPSTGGEGRMMLISVGAMIAMAFAVLMITQKKMSVYKD